MKRTLAIILALCISLSIVSSALAFKCSHPNKMKVRIEYNSQYSTRFKVTSCPNGHNFNHYYYQTGTCTRETWACTTCGQLSQVIKNICITSGHCGESY